MNIKISCSPGIRPFLLCPSPAPAPQFSTLHILSFAPEEDRALFVLTMCNPFRRHFQGSEVASCISLLQIQMSFRNHSVKWARTACFPLWARKNRFSTKIYHLCQYVSKCDGGDLNLSTFVSFNSKASRAAVIVSSSPQKKDLPGITKSLLRSQVKTSAAKKPLSLREKRQRLPCLASSYSKISTGLKAIEKTVKSELFLSPVPQIISLLPYALYDACCNTNI